jgi:hypothetical protein
VPEFTSCEHYTEWNPDLCKLTDFNANQFAPGGSEDFDLPLESFDMMKQPGEKEELHADNSNLG